MNRFQQWLHTRPRLQQGAVIDLLMGLYTLGWVGVLVLLGGPVAQLVAPFEWALLVVAAVTFATGGRVLLDKLTYWAVHEHNRKDG